MPVSEEDFSYFRALPELGESDLAELEELASVETVPPRTDLVIEGVMPDYLYYVLEGDMLLEKSGRIRRIGPNIFVGELSFVLEEEAAGTVTLDKGGRVLSWPAADLRNLIERNENIAAAFNTAFKQDLARKVARS